MQTRRRPGSRACSSALNFAMCSLRRHRLAFPHDVSDRHRHAWGLRPQIRSVRSSRAPQLYFTHIEHLAYVPGEHVPQGMWHDFLICYGQNGQDFIDIQRHVASLTPHCPSPPCSSPPYPLLTAPYSILHASCSLHF